MDILIRCIVVEDEPLARELLENFIHQTPELQLLASFENGSEAFHYLENNKIDLVLSDIDMPLINGIELAKSIMSKPHFIFTTAHEHYALDGFEVGAVDYIKKPVTFARFTKAIAKVNHIIKSEASIHAEEIAQKYLMMRSDGILHRIPLSDIKYLETIGDYIKLHLSDQSSITQLSTMKAMEEKLPSDLFFRIHSSYIVSIKNIRKIFGNTVVLNTGEELAVSKPRKTDLYRRLNVKED